MPDGAQKTTRHYQSGPPHALAFFRVAFGAILFLTWLQVLLHAGNLHLVDWLLFGGMLAMSFLIIIGASMKVAAIAASVAHLIPGGILLGASTQTSILPSGEQALLFALLLIVLAFSGADRIYSYAMFKRYGSALEWEDVRMRPQRLLQLIVTGAYVYIGFYLLWQSMWLSGTRLRSILIGPLGTALAARTARLPLPDVFWNGGLYAIKAFHLMLPLCLWVRPIQKGFIVVGLILHLLAGLFFGQWWLLVLAAGYPLFLDPDDAEVMWGHILQKLRIVQF